ncbi:PSD1 and planctomycete cytochrome C domain-containing protein [Verrucomicrobiaceae bacterium 227]
MITLRHLTLSALSVLLAFAAGGEERPLSFNSDIRPLLSDRCFACHGFDAKAREGDLRLDTAEGAFKHGDNGPAIVPGDPDASPIWQRITSKDPEEVMPPHDSHLTLSASEKSLIHTWITQGAKYEKHWTFTRIERPSAPASELAPLDALILKRLQKDNLTFSPEADQRTLIRRLSLDLRGLPPTPEELKTFLADQSPQAWENLVDRFLADPAFGERMSWPWLDAARYADSNGYQGDNERTMWPWRDWVTDAINRNLPFNDFTVWQIAGDLLPDATHEQKLATGFLRNHAINGEGGSIPEENRVNYVMDMAETVGTTWMGLTFNCCRCHDHKYDALTQANYYGLFDFFNQTPVNGGGGDPQTKPVLTAPSIDQQNALAKLHTELALNDQKLQTISTQLLPRQADWEKEQRETQSQALWTPFSLASYKSSDPGLKIEHLPDGSLFTSGSNPAKLTYTLTAPLPPEPITSIRLDALRHPSYTNGGIARSDSGNFVLTSFEVYLHQKGQSKKHLTLINPRATFEQGSLKIGGALDKNPYSGWAVLEGNSINRDHAALFQLSEPLTSTPDSHLEIILRHDSQHVAHFMGRFALSYTADPSAGFEEKPNALVPLLKIASEQRTPEQAKSIHEAFIADQPEHRELTARKTSLQNEIAKVDKSAPKVMIMGDQEKRRESFILAIGSYEQPGEKVTAHTPDILPPLQKEGEHANRLDLARWLVSRDNPLTARVTVNRLWQEFFGVGFIKSAEDFGVQSEIPKHPEALDWLAADFMDKGWDFKNLVRAIVTSRTYRQSSGITSTLLEKDPENRLLARGPRFRLPAWMIRDQALASSDLLVRKIGGQPVKPWQPPGLWSEVTFGKKKYLPDTGEKLRRRTLYTFWRRISAPPMLFDSAKRETCEVSSNRTNSPLHALAILNDPLYSEAARALASRASSGTPSATLAKAFELILVRPPEEAEQATLEEIYGHALASFTKHPESARSFLAIGETPPDSKLPAIEQAALATVCLSILNTDEALTKE